MILLRVDDVGRLPSDPPEQGSDGDLRHFREWREAAGLVGLPAVYGVVPTWLSDTGRDYLATFDKAAGEHIAVHGITHLAGEEPTVQDMRWARTRLLDADIYIPPFNAYTRDTLRNWHLAGGKYLLGGFFGEHHEYGVTPTYIGINGVLHFSADPLLYGRSWELLKRLDALPSAGCWVLTLHVPWETQPAYMQTIVDKIKPHLVTIEQAALDFSFFSGG